jgi:type VI secretion system protein ImpK
MPNGTTDLAYPILRQGLRILERLRRGERLNMRNEQAELRQLFQMGGPLVPPASDTGDVSLGVRYPLACWLDERFILDEESPWKEAFRQESMEFALFRRVERAWLFPRQAKLPATLGDPDLAEVFYLCVMLGFRGEWREELTDLLNWRDTVETVIGQGKAREWPGKPTDLPLPPTNVPPLKAKGQLRWLLLSYAVAVGLLILVLGYAVTKLLG